MYRVELLVTYKSRSEGHEVIPSKGSVILYPDGLLNICDKGGRVVSSKYGVTNLELIPVDGP